MQFQSSSNCSSRNFFKSAMQKWNGSLSRIFVRDGNPFHFYFIQFLLLTASHTPCVLRHPSAHPRQRLPRLRAYVERLRQTTLSKTLSGNVCRSSETTIIFSPVRVPSAVEPRLSIFLVSILGFQIEIFFFKIFDLFFRSHIFVSLNDWFWMLFHR